jgi:hypothetical protein
MEPSLALPEGYDLTRIREAVFGRTTRKRAHTQESITVIAATTTDARDRDFWDQLIRERGPRAFNTYESNTSLAKAPQEIESLRAKVSTCSNNAGMDAGCSVASRWRRFVPSRAGSVRSPR